MNKFDAGKRYFITGAAGFIGFFLAKQLLENGAQVVGLDNINSYYDPKLKHDRLSFLLLHKNFYFYEADLCDEETLRLIFQQHKPDIVINLAAQAGVRYSLENPKSYIDSNLVGFANILECCRHYPAEHLLFASSSSVYGSNTKMPFSTEDKTDSPVSLYAATKKSNELMAYSYSHLFKMPITGLRFFTVYGPYGRPDMAAFRFTDAVLKGKPIQIFNHGEMERDFTYIDDIITGIIALFSKSAALKKIEDKPPFWVYNIGNNHPEKLMDFISYIEEFTGRTAIKEFLPMQKGDVPKTYADISPLNQDTGFAPSTSLCKGIEKTVKWHREYYKI